LKQFFLQLLRCGSQLVLLLCLGVWPAHAQQRIASLNLCTDLMLLELVDRERIVSLTYWAADPSMSYLADRTDGIHLNHSLVEEIVPRQPDLVLAGQYSNVQVIGMLQALGYPVAMLNVPLTLQGLRDYVLQLGELVGESQRALQMANSIDASLAQASARVPVGAEPLAAIYGAQGVSPGSDTLMNDLLQLAGFRNLAAELGIVSYGTLPLETLVRAQPDVLMVETMVNNGDSVAHQALGHPVLERQFPQARRLQLDASLSVCAGPSVVLALEQLLLARERLQRQDRLVQVSNKQVSND